MVTKEELFKMIQENNIQGIKAFNELLVSYRKLDRKQQIAECEALINSHNQDGQTPIYIAALSDHKEMLREFLKAKADPNKKNIDGLAPIHVAAYFGCMDALKILIEEAKCDINIQKTDGDETAIYLACQENQQQVVSYLISQSVDITKINSEGQTALHVAARHGHSNVIRLLFATEKTDPNKRNNKGALPVHLAAYGGHVESLKIFIEEHNGDVDIAVTGGGDTSLYLACEQHRLNAISYLISKNADVNKGRTDGQTPFFVAVQQGYTDIVQLLLATKKVNINQRRADNGTVLMLSAFLNKLDICKLLLENGADLYLIDDQGNMAIHYAASYGNTAIFDLLVKDWHCKPNIKNRNGITPLMYAANYGRTNAIKEIAKHLSLKDLNTTCERNGITTTAIYLAVQNNHPETLQALINAGCDINIPFLDGKPPIYKAVVEGYLEIVKILVGAGANYDLKDILRYAEKPEIIAVLKDPVLVFEDTFKNLSVTQILTHTFNSPAPSSSSMSNNVNDNNNNSSYLPKAPGQN